MVPNMAKKEFKEVTGMPVIDLRGDNKIVEGVFKAKQPGQYGDNYIIEVDGDDQLLFTSTVISTKMNLVKVGQTVRITYMGEKKSTESGRLYKDYKVETA